MTQQLHSARAARARTVKRESQHTRVAQQATFLKSSTSPTVLPGAPLREVVSLGKAADLPCVTSAVPQPQNNYRHTKSGLAHAQHNILVQYTNTYLCNRTA